MGVKERVVIHCPELSCSYGNDGEFLIVPSLDLPEGYIVGSVGAGDAFCAGMLYAFINGMDMESAMRLASCAAACNLSVADSVSGARTFKETLDMEKTQKRRII